MNKDEFEIIKKAIDLTTSNTNLIGNLIDRVLELERQIEKLKEEYDR